jgi:hypothetical protein
VAAVSPETGGARRRDDGGSPELLEFELLGAKLGGTNTKRKLRSCGTHRGLEEEEDMAEEEIEASAGFRRRCWSEGGEERRGVKRRPWGTFYR